MAHPVVYVYVKGRLCEHVSAGGGTEGIVSEYLSIDFLMTLLKSAPPYYPQT